MFDKNDTVGIILAHRKPLSIYGTITAIRRVTLVLRKAGINPIIIVTGKQSLEVERSLSDFGVIFIRGEEHEAETDGDYARLGLLMAKRLYNRVVMASTQYPLVSPETVKQILHRDDAVIMTRKNQELTYPVSIQKQSMKEILEKKAEDIFQLIKNYSEKISYFDTQDVGVLLDKKDSKLIEEVIPNHNKMLLQPYTITCIETENFFFDKRTLLLLNLIEEFSSVKKACEHMAISYAKAWDSLNTLEEIVGYQIVIRSHGGKRGGGTTLTEEGKRFIKLYDEYNQKVKKFSSDCFFEMFPEFWANKND